MLVQQVESSNTTAELEGVGIAAMALFGNINLADFSNQDVRKVLADTGRLPKIYGVEESLAALNLRAFEVTM